MSSLADFGDILRRDEPLAPLTWLKVGGPAQYLLRPRSFNELAQVVQSCHEQNVPIHVLGAGSNVLVRDEGVGGVVLRLDHDEFSRISVEGNRVIAAAGASLAHVISHSVKAGL